MTWEEQLHVTNTFRQAYDGFDRHVSRGIDGKLCLCTQAHCCGLSMHRALPLCSSISLHTLTTCCPQLEPPKAPRSLTAQLNSGLGPPMTPGPAGKPSVQARATLKGRDRVLAKCLAMTGMIGRLPPNTLLGDRTIPEEPIAGMTSRSSIALMITCMHQAVTRPQYDMEGAVAM